MSLDVDGDGLSRGSFNPAVLPETGIVRLDSLHTVVGCSRRTVELWVREGMPVMRHRLKSHYVRISRWIEFMERYDKGLPPKDAPAERRRKAKGDT